LKLFDPFDVQAGRELELFGREFDRMFGRPAQRSPRRAVFLPGRAARAYPLINIGEDVTNFYVEALAPGISIENLEISIVRNVLTISGSKTGPEGVPTELYHRSERSAGKFVRTVELSGDVDPDNVSAKFTNGILLITLPKTEAAKPRQIQVNVE